MQASRTMIVQLGKWTLFGAGILGTFFSFVAWFFVPGTADLSRIIVAGLFASLAMNAFLLSAVLFCDTADNDARALAAAFRTPPIIASALLVIGFILIAATVPWWAKH